MPDHDPMRRLTRLLISLLALAAASPATAGALTVFAAASLSDAMTEAGLHFEKARGIPVRFSFAASSTLARQIEAGAPAGIVALASEDWADYLTERGLILLETRASPIGNRLVLIAPPGDRLALSDPPTPAELAAALSPPNRLAMADPAHVPAGIYAMNSLKKLGLWEAVSRRLALTDNVRAALALVVRGEAALGIVYATDVHIAPGVRSMATLPAASHPTISYAFAVTRDGDTPEARAFLNFLCSAEGQAIFGRFGFTRN